MKNQLESRAAPSYHFPCCLAAVTQFRTRWCCKRLGACFHNGTMSVLYLIYRIINMLEYTPGQYQTNTVCRAVGTSSATSPVDRPACDSSARSSMRQRPKPLSRCLYSHATRRYEDCPVVARIATRRGDSDVKIGHHHVISL